MKTKWKVWINDLEASGCTPIYIYSEKIQRIGDYILIVDNVRIEFDEPFSIVNYEKVE